MLVAGIDLGGTNIRCAVADARRPGRIVAHVSLRTPARGDTEAVLDAVADAVSSCMADAEAPPESLQAVGCTAPGITDARAGVVIDAANLAGWRNVPLRALLQERFDRPAVVENDVNAAAMGEYAFGAGQGFASVVYLTISTGVAAGIVVDGRLLRGAHHAAGELGYFLPDADHIGKDWRPSGCLEMTSAGIGMARAWAELKGGSDASDRAREVFAAAGSGDADAETLVRRAADNLALAAVAVGTLIDPDVLILGGSIALHQPRIFDRIRNVVTQTLLFPPSVARAALGGKAPLVGALSLAAALPS